MGYVLTLVASEGGSPLKDKHFKAIEGIIPLYNLSYTDRLVWLDKGKAAAVGFSGKAPSALVAHIREILEKDRIDFFITTRAPRLKKLLLADMDSTITTGETLDDLAGYAGIGEAVAQITARAMNGELDFHDALRERVGLLEGLAEQALYETLEKTVLSPGAECFVRTMGKMGATCVLVSGGFTFFTHAIADRCGFHFDHGNVLCVAGGVLSGAVEEPILDKNAKFDVLMRYMGDLNLEAQDCLTIGDGANDLPMLRAAGLGIGYHPKDVLKKELPNCILYGDLTAALYAQGISARQFV